MKWTVKELIVATLVAGVYFGLIGDASAQAPGSMITFVSAEAAPAAPANGNGNGKSCQACEEKKEEEKKDEECPEEEEEEAPSCNLLNSLLLGDCFTEKTGVSVGGWTVMSFTWNPQNPADRMNGPVTFNDRANDFLLNQQYLYIQRAVDTEGDKIDFGGRVDFMYGTDAVFTQALGWDHDLATDSPLYRLAIPQMYAEMYAPVMKGLTVKVGHFYTIIGYDVVTTPDDFFATLAYTFQYGEPFTHTGALASLKVTDSLTVQSGVVRGWDSWEDNNNALSYLGGISYANEDTGTTVTLTGITGPENDEPRTLFQGLENAAGGSSNRFMYSLVVQQKLGEKLKYVIQHDHGIQESTGGAGFFGLAATPHAEWYGVNQYLIYDINDKFSVGGRAEWFRDDDGVRVGIARLTNTLGPQAFDARFADGRNVTFGGGISGANYYALAFGLNYKPTNCITFRPELRWDWQVRDDQNTLPAYDARNRTQQFLAAFDVIFKY